MYYYECIVIVMIYCTVYTLVNGQLLQTNYENYGRLDYHVRSGRELYVNNNYAGVGLNCTVIDHALTI